MSKLIVAPNMVSPPCFPQLQTDFLGRFSVGTECGAAFGSRARYADTVAFWMGHGEMLYKSLENLKAFKEVNLRKKKIFPPRLDIEKNEGAYQE